MNTEDRRHAGSIDCGSPWRRWLALLSLVLVVLVPQAHSVLQHGLSLHVASVTSPAAPPVAFEQASQHWDDDTSVCTLCSVLGSATQPAGFSSARPVEFTLKIASAKDQPFVPERWTFDQLSRPPPGSTLDEFLAG